MNRFQRERDRDAATVALIVAFGAVGLALLIAVVCVGPMLASLGWRGQ